MKFFTVIEVVLAALVAAIIIWIICTILKRATMIPEGTQEADSCMDIGQLKVITETAQAQREISQQSGGSRRGSCGSCDFTLPDIPAGLLDEADQPYSGDRSPSIITPMTDSESTTPLDSLAPFEILPSAVSAALDAHIARTQQREVTTGYLPATAFIRPSARDIGASLVETPERVDSLDLYPPESDYVQPVTSVPSAFAWGTVWRSITRSTNSSDRTKVNSNNGSKSFLDQITSTFSPKSGTGESEADTLVSSSSASTNDRVSFGEVGWRYRPQMHAMLMRQAGQRADGAWYVEEVASMCKEEQARMVARATAETQAHVERKQSWEEKHKACTQARRRSHPVPVMLAHDVKKKVIRIKLAQKVLPKKKTGGFERRLDRWIAKARTEPQEREH
ncbi:hypothetical protein IAU60_002264 [Kwoniella sp. DSM 27419]